MSPRSFRAALVAAVLAGGTFAPPASAVIGGSEAPSPLAASSVMVLSARGGMCSGIVVTPAIVLTAAHCVAGSEARVHWREAGEPVLVAPSAVAVHPRYDSGAIAGRRRSIDLALVRIPSPLPARFVPATLGGYANKGERTVLGGYGVAREGDARSTGTFRTAALAVAEPYGPSRILVWLDDPSRSGRGPCTGDSGGPIADAAGAVLAVTTWASAGGRAGCGGMSQGVLLAPERSWLDRTVAGWGGAAAWR